MPDLGDLFDDFRQEAFRLETLDDYSQSGSVDAYRLFLDGRERPADYNDDWLAEVRAHTDAGRRMYRVHVVRRPLTPYLRFELGWGYRTNATAGEEFFILDVTDRPNPLPDGVGDFWLFDSTTPAQFHYSQDGKFLGADVLPDDRPTSSPTTGEPSTSSTGTLLWLTLSRSRTGGQSTGSEPFRAGCGAAGAAGSLGEGGQGRCPRRCHVCQQAQQGGDGQARADC
ncbi:hypothetical protein STRAU_4554 [Streptomyces aurantiacus JA 4570]|uniref:DUF6879 domain-containing protein n=1 Tax=Streptomyces aurantiacus JA 4570 TaxID=1286094 RepID=S3ZI65_9ACTN|nr:hypothetical protein STRAU_4554 [Streptomyces aurantiacus JA 4570]